MTNEELEQILIMRISEVHKNYSDLSTDGLQSIATGIQALTTLRNSAKKEDYLSTIVKDIFK